MKSEFCKNGDGRPRHGKYAVCHECLKARDRAYAKKVFVAASWYELNLKDLLHDAKIMDTSSLSIRYRRSQSAICEILQRYGVSPKKRRDHIYVAKGKMNIKEIMPDLSRDCFVGVSGKETFVPAQ